MSQTALKDDPAYKAMRQAETDNDERNDVLKKLVRNDRWRMVERLVDKNYTPIELDPEVIELIAEKDSPNWEYIDKLTNKVHRGQVRLTGPLDIETDSGYNWRLIKCFAERDMLDGVQYWHEQDGPLRAWELYRTAESLQGTDVLDYMLDHESFTDGQLAKAMTGFFCSFINKARSNKGAFEIDQEDNERLTVRTIRQLLDHGLPLNHGRYRDTLDGQYERYDLVDPYPERWPDYPVALPVLLFESQYMFRETHTVQITGFSIMSNAVIKLNLIPRCIEQGILPGPDYFHGWLFTYDDLKEAPVLFKHLREHNLHPSPDALREHGVAERYRPYLNKREQSYLDARR